MHDAMVVASVVKNLVRCVISLYDYATAKIKNGQGELRESAIPQGLFLLCVHKRWLMSNAYLAEMIRDAAPEISRARALLIARNVMGGIRGALHTRGKVVLHGVGSLRVAERPAGVRRNPRTGISLHSPAVKVVRFRPSGALKSSLNEVAPPRKVGEGGERVS